MDIRFRSSVIFVKDVARSRQFYEGVLKQKVELDHGQCVSYGGFSIWQADHARSIVFGGQPEPGTANPGDSHSAGLYFVTEDVDTAFAGISRSGAKLVHPVFEQPWGQRVFRIYDPDGHIVEFGEPMEAVIRRRLKEGMTVEETTARTLMPREIVEKVAEALRAK